MKHIRIFGLQIISVLQFKLRAFVWLLVGCVNTAIILIFWRAAALGTGIAADLPSIERLTSYYILLITLGSVVVSHVEEDVAERDIQKGNLSIYLLKPYSYLQIKFLEEVVWRLLGGFWGVVLFVVLFLFIPMYITSDPVLLLAAIVSSVIALIISFLFKMIIGMMAFWLTHIYGFLDFVEIVTIVLIGAILPIASLPEPLKTIAVHSPFASMLYAPVALFSGVAGRGELTSLFIHQAVWLVVMFIGYKLVFKLGVRSYTGVGQ